MILQATIMTTLLLHATAPADPDGTTARARLSDLLAAQRGAVLASEPAVAAADEPAAADPSISAVYPNRAFLERTLDVTISGDDTEWTDAVAVDFGDGIRVDSVRVASPTGLVARITIDEDAALGARDVTVREGEVEAVYAGAFTLQAPLAFKVLKGTRAPGSILTGTLVQHDISTPFDPTENTLYVDEPGFTVDYFYAQQYRAEFALLVDVPVAPGTYDLHVVSGEPGSQVRSTGPDILPIGARTPLELKAGDNVGTLAEPYGTVLYTFTPPAEPTRVTFTVTPGVQGASPVLAVLPASGRFADLIAADVRVVVDTDAPEPLYVIYWDAAGAEKHDFTINVATTPPPPPETEPNDECAAATRVAASSSTLGSLRDATDVDWFVFTVEDADVGKTVHVRTQPGEQTTDTIVEVFAGDCTTSLGGPSPDYAYHEDFTSSPVTTAGDIYVKVSHSAAAYSAGDYELVIALE
ncbi:Quinohemoprotein amine dehydrogenase, alpha subunit domain III [Nannocystis exedens]|uniref:Quinohemoprotein amine dehydrogenase, alpha subunit domain III n=1 Tax=Nannocystis exedens TaxID=54 RepID=A0A1I2CCB4_9BACT|nr:hypothetical protein [Nannocystis exedens]PCC68389.1 hypothetical protein NAEX_01399 [Nannocystis exedens]SFE65805.1 Quinohemoprotein amine dehydrogenase, alpha subunit domain III [Nannocystis exedens]